MLPKLCICLAIITLFAAAVFPQSGGRDQRKEEIIWEQLKVIAPGTVDDFKAATTAMDAGNYDEAVRLYGAVLKKAPEFDPVLRRLGISLVLKGEVNEGLDLLEQAVARNRTADNLISLANYLAYPGPNKEGTREQKWRAYWLAHEAEQLPKTGDDGDYLALLAQLALEFQQVDVFRSTTEKLVATHQELMATHYFNAILAANDEKWMTAENEIRKAESMGLPHDVAQEFLDSGVHSNASVWRYAIYGTVLVAVWLVGLALLFLVGKIMSKLTLRSIEAADPNIAASSSELLLRKWYRALINVAGLYYYVSIPVVILLVLAVAATITYLTFVIGRIPIKLMLILWFGTIVTVYKMIRSLFVKIKLEDPGRSLSHEEAPQLWDLTRRVAETIGTRPVDEIRVTPGTDLAVYESGSFRERSRDRARRILILGIGLLNGFEQSGFCAVLAHEYGHFSHRDTAGGDVALRVNADMMKFGHALIMSHQAVWWNIAFHFLRIYHFIFRRISYGATRLQEVLADRVAALKYGARAFEEGLKHVVRKSAEFDLVATGAISAYAGPQRTLQNLYDLQIADDARLENQVETALNCETTEDDTHPSPNDRFRFARKVSSQSEPPASGMVWDLFMDKDGLTREMTLVVEQNLREAGY
jgi:Zn-dependent protease with chaperone function